MPVARTLCGLAALAGTSAPAFAQYPLLAPTAPNKIIYPAPPWVFNPGRPGAVPAAAAPQANEARPNWTGPQPHPVAVDPPPVPLPAPDRPLPTLATPPAADPGLPAIPNVAPAPVAIPTPPATTPMRPTVVPAPKPIPAPAAAPRPDARPATPTRTSSRPDVWAPQYSIPATLPGTVVPAGARGR